MEKVKGYLATHFFNEAGFEWTAKVAEQIRSRFPNLDLYVPQENGEINDKSGNDAEITDVAIARGDNDRLRYANILIANLDGVEIDSGVSCEIGYFLGRAEAESELSLCPMPRMCIGLYTDMRQDGSDDNHYYINLYTKGCAKEMGVVVRSIEEVCEQIEKFIGLYFGEYDLEMRTGFHTGEVARTENFIQFDENKALGYGCKVLIKRFEEDAKMMSGIAVYGALVYIGDDTEGFAVGDTITMCSSLIKKDGEAWLN